MSARQVDEAVAEALATLESVAREFAQGGRHGDRIAVEKAANELRRARFAEKENYHHWQEAKGGSEPIQVRHKAGKCPVCRDYLWAEVTIQVSTSEPTLSEDGRASAAAYAQALAASIEAHSCDIREPLPDWEAELLRDAEEKR